MNIKKDFIKKIKCLFIRVKKLEEKGESSPSGVQSVTGNGVGGSSDNPVLTFPTPQQINAATSQQGLKADTALQPSDAVDIAEAGKVVKYSNIGAVNTVEPQFPENAVNLAYLNSILANKVDVVPNMGLSKENFTSEEKAKLAGVEDPKFKGQYLSLADLLASGNGEVGGYAYVDNGVTIDMYIWDNTNEQWDIVVGESTAETPASIKSKYESNPDTNAFTDALKNKLEAFTANFTSTLKTAYDNAVSWITVNGANILNHLSNTNNPHNVTADQLGIVGLENLGKVWTPDYSNMETTNRITTHGGTWTVPAGRRGWVKLYTRTYTGGVLDAEVFLINGKVMENIWQEATSGTGTARSGSRSGLFQVKGGDTVQVHGNLERSCYFIPGIWV